MSRRLKILLGVCAVEVLAVVVPALLLRPAHHTPVRATPGVTVEATSPPSASPVGDGEAKPPVVLPGFTGAAKVAGQALLDKMMGRQNEMTMWANGERTRIKDMEPRLEQMEQHIKDLGARADDLQRQLEQKRADPASTADYDALQKSFNDVVAERNETIRQYDEQFAEYNRAVKDFDGRIAAYDSSVHKLQMPDTH
jgi:hypothetical protein